MEVLERKEKPYGSAGSSARTLGTIPTELL